MYQIFVTDVTSQKVLKVILSGFVLRLALFGRISLLGIVRYDLQIEPDALIALFGCSKTSLALPPTVQQTLMFGMLVANEIILKEWKATSASCFST